MKSNETKNKIDVTKIAENEFRKNLPSKFLKVKQFLDK